VIGVWIGGTDEQLRVCWVGVRLSELGLFFSLGHSTIVIVVNVALAIR
jgi:high-affinity nickel permease